MDRKNINSEGCCLYLCIWAPAKTHLIRQIGSYQTILMVVQYKNLTAAEGLFGDAAGKYFEGRVKRLL